MLVLPYPLAEQREQYTQQIQSLDTGQAFIRLPNDTVRRVRTPTLSQVSVTTEQLQAVRQHYQAAYFRLLPRPVAPAALAPTPGPDAPPQAHAIHRYHPDEHPRRSR